MMAAVFRKMYSSPAMSVTSRVIAALLGGYVLATAAGIAVAAWLPGEKHNGVIAGMLLTFTFWVGAVIWCFATRTAVRAWLGLLLVSGLLVAISVARGWIA
jgi:ethanolamine transporter EutH